MSSKLNSIIDSTKEYEEWISKHIPLYQPDLDLKHARMGDALFPFFRATFYRWVQLWPIVCPELNSAPVVLAVGDLHVENFGTWRDAEGRLVWGINDFDEVTWLPCVYDLVRLTTSAVMAFSEAKLQVDSAAAAAAILEGYVEGVRESGNPFVLAESHRVVRKLASKHLKDPESFWSKLESLPTLEEDVPADAAQALLSMLPEKNLPVRFARRVSGLGSLGRQRFVVIAKWRGGKIAREVKALAPTAVNWQSVGNVDNTIYLQAVLERSVRCQDPYVKHTGNWLLRRLAPDCSRIDFAEMRRLPDILRLLHCMGWETANIHLGSIRGGVILDYLKGRPRGWLLRAAKAMEREIAKDWIRWRRERRVSVSSPLTEFDDAAEEEEAKPQTQAPPSGPPAVSRL